MDFIINCIKLCEHKAHIPKQNSYLKKQNKTKTKLNQVSLQNNQLCGTEFYQKHIYHQSVIMFVCMAKNPPCEEAHIPNQLQIHKQWEYQVLNYEYERLYLYLLTFYHS